MVIGKNAVYFTKDANIIISLPYPKVCFASGGIAFKQELKL